MKKSALILPILLFLSGCATPHVVTEEKVSDSSLSCEQLMAEIEEAEEFEEKARDEKGVTGTNVAAAILFWPAIAGTYMNANEAIEAAQKRQEHLNDLHRSKGCN